MLLRLDRWPLTVAGKVEGRDADGVLFQFSILYPRRFFWPRLLCPSLIGSFPGRRRSQCMGRKEEEGAESEGMCPLILEWHGPDQMTIGHVSTFPASASLFFVALFDVYVTNGIDEVIKHGLIIKRNGLSRYFA